VHNQDLSINDIKPDNMYMDGQGNVDIGDFGGVTKIGEGFRETTQNYIPQDMYESNVAIPAVDYMCLINSIIEMSGGRIGGNVKQLREAVDRVNNQNVRNRLLTMLE
jgi:serine/threonine protein kinase